MTPNAQNHTPTPEYLRQLIKRIDKSQRWIAEASGISERRLRYLVAGKRTIADDEKPVLMDYTEQYVLEQLADAADVFNRK
jgi:plasmid maintenance system antidote protein VapI